MATNTPNYSFLLPTVGGDVDLWGGFLNQNWSDLDDLLSGTGSLNGVDIINATGQFTTLNATGGTLDGMQITDSSVQANSLHATNEIKEDPQTLNSPNTTTPDVDPKNGGTLAQWTLTAGIEHTPSFAGMLDGEYISLQIAASTGTISWGGVVFINGVPELDPSTSNFIEIFKRGGVVYGVYVGSV
jgi:hypothetical protein